MFGGVIAEAVATASSEVVDIFDEISLECRIFSVYVGQTTHTSSGAFIAVVVVLT